MWFAPILAWLVPAGGMAFGAFTTFTRYGMAVCALLKANVALLKFCV